MQATTPHAFAAGNASDASYEAFLGRIRDRFMSNVDKAPVFTTNAEDLWDVYLGSFPEPMRQYHNCHACRRFVERFGGLVTIDEAGFALPAVWHPGDADADHMEAIVAMTKRLRRAVVNGIFLSSEPVWGQPHTPSKKGEWIHLHLVPSKDRIFTRLTQNASQAMAEKLEDFKNVQRALEEFTAPMLAQALTLLNADALYRSEKVLGPAKWLADLHAAIATHKGRRTNLVWRAVASAPPGFCHPRSSMVGTLLEDIAAGLPFEDVAAKFKAKMHPLQYQRPQAAPSAGNIAQAEKIIAELGAAGSLERRFARLDEVEAIWRPAKVEEPKGGGVFSHLQPKDAAGAIKPMDVPAKLITFEKFRATILSGAKTIEFNVPHSGNFVAILTAANPDAPPILQWDSAERRNPFSWYVYNGGSPAAQWGLAQGWTRVTALTLQPSSWFGGNYPHHGQGGVFLLDGAKDTCTNSGNALFPECLKSELHSIRSTIEAYSKNATIAAGEGPYACGYVFSKGSSANAAWVRVTDASGARFEYRIDRWD